MDPIEDVGGSTTVEDSAPVSAAPVSQPESESVWADDEDYGVPVSHDLGTDLSPGSASDPTSSAQQPSRQRDANGRFVPAKPQEQQKPAAAPPAPEQQIAKEPAERVAPQPAEPPAPEWEPSLLDRAQAYGFAAHEAKAFGSPLALENVLTAMDRKAVAEIRAQHLRAQQEQQFQQPPQRQIGQQQWQQAPPPAPPPQNAQQQWAQQQQHNPGFGQRGQPNPPTSSPDRFEIKLNPQDYDEETLGVLNGLNDHHHARYTHVQQELHATRQELEALKAELGGFTQRQRDEEAARFATEMDTFFNGLGDEFREIYGQGEFPRLTPALRDARQQFVDEMTALMIADDRLGRPRGTPQQLADRVVRVLHSDKLESKVRKQLSQKVQARQGQAVSRPTPRGQRSLSPEHSAASFANEFYKQRMADDPAPAEL